ncbi:MULTISPECIES: antitoxin VbhA family protein [unclassified Pseudomonas]|uniref:antitoxin VbhA family protein n=1 Tax=unclassified Pseudomonas TaxID=196821 RepID=UPI002B232444|nr:MULTISPECIES: antitoxin VbhA family protein [unclassified Pseudomonas]MEA9979701.1 antitoxin VbhA family protein [Pseudomonas sp. RTS4]MEB0196469.1 antitoxin VbhA family protein [Pseudomonas sp. 5S4]MEB0247548.1 antitoxin VbhA family protein [Pseudomonas sp. 10S5]
MTSENHKTTQQQDNAAPSAEIDQLKEHQISESEQGKRKETVDFANSSVKLSGFEVTKGMKRLGERYISGEIDLDEFVSISQQENASSLPK